MIGQRSVMAHELSEVWTVLMVSNFAETRRSPYRGILNNQFEEFREVSMSQTWHPVASLTGVSEDVLVLVGEACSDPLIPNALANLAATSRQTLSTLRPKLKELREFRSELQVLCSEHRRGIITLSSLVEAKALILVKGHRCRILGRLLQRRALPCLEKLHLDSSQVNDQGVVALVRHVTKGSLPNLTSLLLGDNQIGEGGMRTLSGVVAEGSIARLKWLALNNNRIGDAGMVAFVGAIVNGALPALERVYLSSNQISDEGTISFTSAVASGRSMVKLKRLYLGQNQIGDKGMRALSSALAGGALPALLALGIDGNPGRIELVTAACEAREVWT